MSGQYQLRLELGGLLLFLLIMAPNCLWFAAPAPRDVLRAAPEHAALDAVSAVSQVLAVAALCLCRRRERLRLRPTPLLCLAALACLLYYAAWAAYYAGAAGAIVIWGLTIPPCLALIFFALDRRNLPALPPLAVFTVCHALHAAAICAGI